MLITSRQPIHNPYVWIINRCYTRRGDYLLKISSQRRRNSTNNHSSTKRSRGEKKRYSHPIGRANSS